MVSARLLIQSPDSLFTKALPSLRLPLQHSCPSVVDVCLKYLEIPFRTSATPIYFQQVISLDYQRGQRKTVTRRQGSLQRTIKADSSPTSDVGTHGTSRPQTYSDPLDPRSVSAIPSPVDRGAHADGATSSILSRNSRTCS